MLIRKTISVRGIFAFSGHHLWWLLLYMFLVSAAYQLLGLRWISIPWLPVSLIGTAVAFYVGFKNNQSYDRVWEARKIWGAIVNSSRSWGAMVQAFVRSDQRSTEELTQIKTRMIYRHLGWIYTLREQLLQPTGWEHVSQRWHFGRINKVRRERYGEGAFKDQLDPGRLQRYAFDAADWENAANKATHILYRQSQELAALEDQQILHMRRQLDLQQVLNDFYDHQGRAERIKRFPLPRQYANLSFIFVCIFIFLLPLGIVAEFAKLGSFGVWLMIPFGTLVGWIYVVMELIGDYSENPFEGLTTDVPMLSICRTIEIDLLHMLGERDVPKPIQAVSDVLM